MLVATLLNSAALDYQLEDRTMLNHRMGMQSTKFKLWETLSTKKPQRGKKRCGAETLRLKET